MKNYTKRITSAVLLLAIVVGSTSFTKFGNVNAKEAPLTPQEPAVLNEGNVQDTATQTPVSNYREATFITKDGSSQIVDLDNIDHPDFNGMTITIRPTYRSVDSDGHTIYKEGSSCLSITDHGIANHKKVHLWNNKSNEIKVVHEVSGKPPYSGQPGYSLYDCGGFLSMGLFTAFEVTDEGYNVPHKYLRGHFKHDQQGCAQHPWQLFDFDVVTTKVGSRRIYLARWHNYGSNLPIGLKDESSTKNGNEVETKDADAQDLWVIEAK